MNASGKFVISLDFELIWGVRDITNLEKYGENIKGVHTAIPKMLETFSRHDIKATFATVGFLFFKGRSELHQNLPALLPGYSNPRLSPYADEIFQVGENNSKDPYHFAPQLIELIKSYPGQEIGTHTFSHYYCLEEGQTVDQFREDIRAAVKTAATFNIEVKSIVFPRNQFNNDYLNVCEEFGISSVRGNENSWLYEGRPNENESSIRRICRLLDAYVNLSGHHCYDDRFMTKTFPYNIPSSRFLRPYIKKVKMFESLRLRRIRNGMTKAAKNNQTYHLWWHPHNFGIDQEENLAFLDKILTHYNYLNSKYNFTNYTMTGLANYLQEKYGTQ